VSKHHIDIFVNNQAAASGLQLMDSVIECDVDTLNPIDRFHERLTYVLVSIGKVPPDLESLAFRLFYVGMLSATEKFFRDLVCRVVSFCPISRARMRESNLQFGAIQYYSSDKIAAGILQGKSLSDAAELKTLIRKISAIELKPNDEISVALEEFSNICQVRHALVHSYGELGLNNISGMGISKFDCTSEINVDNALFQSSAVVCNNLVKVVNQSIFESTVSSWIDQSKLSGIWKEDKSPWNECWSIFASKDHCNPNTSYKAWGRIRSIVAARAQSK
jgi:hypothetical protein